MRSPHRLLVIGLIVIVVVTLLWVGYLWKDRSVTRDYLGLITLPGIAWAEKKLYREDLDGNGVADYWTRNLRGLAAFHEKGKSAPLLEERIAAADASPGGSPPVPFRGYLFVAVARGASMYGFCAYPTHRWAGSLTFLVGGSDDGFDMLAKDTHGAPVTTWPADPLAEGWERIDR